jgi:hypothetical protein
VREVFPQGDTDLRVIVYHQNMTVRAHYRSDPISRPILDGRIRPCWKAEFSFRPALIGRLVEGPCR